MEQTVASGVGGSGNIAAPCPGLFRVRSRVSAMLRAHLRGLWRPHRMMARNITPVPKAHVMARGLGLGRPQCLLPLQACSSQHSPGCADTGTVLIIDGQSPRLSTTSGTYDSNHGILIHSPFFQLMKYCHSPLLWNVTPESREPNVLPRHINSGRRYPPLHRIGSRSENTQMFACGRIGERWGKVVILDSMPRIPPCFSCRDPCRVRPALSTPSPRCTGQLNWQNQCALQEIATCSSSQSWQDPVVTGIDPILGQARLKERAAPKSHHEPLGS